MTHFEQLAAIVAPLAHEAIAQYEKDLSAGGEPVAPMWAYEVVKVIRCAS